MMDDMGEYEAPDTDESFDDLNAIYEAGQQVVLKRPDPFGTCGGQLIVTSAHQSILQTATATATSRAGATV